MDEICVTIPVKAKLSNGNIWVSTFFRLCKWSSSVSNGAFGTLRSDLTDLITDYTNVMK